MSDDVNVHIWQEPNSALEGLELFGRVLECVAIPRHLDNGRLFTRFEHIKVYDRSFTNTVLDEAIQTNDMAEVLSRLEAYTGSTIHCEVSSVFDCFRFDQTRKQLDPGLKPLTINYYSSGYGWNGLEFKSYGFARLDFSNTKAFRIPQVLVQNVRDVSENGGDPTEALRIIGQLGRNYDVVSDVAKRVIVNLDPTHLLICTDLEVHPLTSHAMYHRDWKDYARDLTKIARLHEFGGLYFCEIRPDDPAFRGPRKSPPDYGYLRGHYGAGIENSFVKTLQPMVNAILRDPKRLQLSRDQLEESFRYFNDTQVQQLNNSYYLSVIGAPFAYLEEPYFNFWDQLDRSGDSSSSQ